MSNLARTAMPMNPALAHAPAAPSLVQFPKAGTERYRMSGDEIRRRFGDVTPVYKGGARLLRWNNSHASGMTLGLKLVEVDEHYPHPFKGLRATLGSASDGQRLFLVVNHRDPETNAILANVYCGEAILEHWAESCDEGYKVRMKLDDGPDGAGRIHPFDGLSTGRVKGEQLSLVCWGIADDERPEPAKKKRSLAEMPPISQTHILCKNDAFFHFLVKNESRLVLDALAMEDIQQFKEGNREKYCECVIKMWCGIESRAELKGDDDGAVRARELWSRLVEDYERARWGI
jgi:hypothetical protein